MKAPVKGPGRLSLRPRHTGGGMGSERSETTNCPPNKMPIMHLRSVATVGATHSISFYIILHISSSTMFNHQCHLYPSIP